MICKHLSDTMEEGTISSLIFQSFIIYIQIFQESGIEDVNDVKLLIDIGYDGFLIGERFMKSKNPSWHPHFINRV